VNAQPGPLRVAIVDDHPMFRLGLAAAIKEMDGIDLVGEAQRADQVAALVEAASPTVILLDIRLPDASGLEVNVHVVVLTMSEDLDSALTALRDGASGYLVKGAGAERVEHALRAVAAGDVVLDQTLVQAMTELVQSRRASPVRPFRSSPTESSASCSSSLKDSTTRRSRAGWSSVPRRSATTCPTCSRRSTPVIVPEPSSRPTGRASAPDVHPADACTPRVQPTPDFTP
jgi:DNA-binding NarL/FixJ family response regulator